MKPAPTIARERRNETPRHHTPGDDRLNQLYGALHETGGGPGSKVALVGGLAPALAAARRRPRPSRWRPSPVAMGRRTKECPRPGVGGRAASGLSPSLLDTSMASCGACARPQREPAWRQHLHTLRHARRKTDPTSPPVDATHQRCLSVMLVVVRGVGSKRCCRSWPSVMCAAPRTCRTGRRGLIGAWHRPH